MRHVAFIVVGCVHCSVEMCADVQCRIDTLCDDTHRLQILCVIHLVAGIADPARGMHIHNVREIDDFHRMALSADI
jgi:hypothetical protein